MSAIDRLVEFITGNTKPVIVAVLLITLVMGAGMAQVSQDSSQGQFTPGSDAAEAQTYIEENFQSTDENTTRVQVIFHEGDQTNVLTQEALVREIELQQEFTRTEEINSTLTEQPFFGLSNAVALASIEQRQGGGGGGAPPANPTLEEQRQELESMSNERFTGLLEQLLSGDSGQSSVASLVPRDFDAGTTSAEARQMSVSQDMIEEPEGQGMTTDRIVESQLAMEDVINERYGDDAFAFGSGLVTEEMQGSLNDSLAIVLPLALLFVTVVLTIAYRDVLDILLGLLGIAMVLIWTFGLMGWANISFNQIMIAVPVLLVGLSIDYAIHVFMRHREQRAEADNGGSRKAMRTVLLGLGGALVWVTATAVIGFLSNLASPLPPLQDFGIVSAFGITATLIIYGSFIPAVKLEFDEYLEGRGWDRTKPAFGTGGGAFTTFLSGGKTFAQRAPWAVVAVALLLTLGGAYGATQVDTSFQQEDFLADDPPDVLDSLPEPFAPGDYQIKSQLDVISDYFSQDQTTTVLIRGNVTADDTLERIHATQNQAAEDDAFAKLLNGQPQLQSPLRGMQTYANENPNSTFNATFHGADTDGNGVPDTDLQEVYTAYYEAAPGQAAGTISLNQETGEYEAVQLVVTKDGSASTSETASATQDLADYYGTTGESDQSAIATGQLVVFDLVEQELFDSVIQTLVITIVAVIAFLMIAYRYVHGSAILGAITLLPIVLSVAWILGTMWLMDIGFNVITGTITSLTIGLGVAYNIHVSERFQLELDRGKGVWDAIGDAVTGTGGALLGSAGTTVGGFGVLAFAILPPLQDFGIITGITIIYAFLGSVFVLPTFLVLWTKYLGPAEAFEESPGTVETGEVAPADE